MKRSLSVLSRAVLIGVSAAVLVAPAALAAPPAGAPIVEQPDKETPQEMLAALVKRADQLDVDAAAAGKAVAKAATFAEAKKAKEAAVKAKKDATQLDGELIEFLRKYVEIPSADRLKATQTMTRVEKVADELDKVVEAAEKKIKELEPAPAKGDITIQPSSAARGDVIAIVVFCPEGKISGFASDAIDIVPESRYDEGNVSAIGGFVKKDAAPGAHTATATCGSDKLSATFTVTVAAPVQAKKPTADDVRRKTVVKPKGKIETGGGATAQSSI